MSGIRPFFGRITVLESPVDEAQRRSGLIVPMAFDGSDEVKRGVVLDVDAVDYDTTETGAEQIPRGTVVYYRNGVRIGEVVVLDRADVLAYEATE